MPAGKYYIVRCEYPDHTVHFNGETSALIRASKHLSSAFHGISRARDVAIACLGVEVLGCSPEKQAANNTVFEEELINRYTPLNTRKGVESLRLTEGNDADSAHA
ncbi:hypothetical protein IMZ48_02250 [Candidatus Bathyarchaeota archaeon]|nr:hypothetical protein [Candidatus Bathyarchaeota archaeon]